ncbi:ankyrin repeat domain-containing protein 37 isoform X5 [Ailuropoda melanoleuca]|nr:ankyrin repeat domain-containing protein 37 isoform X5 [Ailuropoda melanoleuca]
MAAAGAPPPGALGGARALGLRGGELRAPPRGGPAWCLPAGQSAGEPRLSPQRASRGHVPVFVYVLLPQGGERPGRAGVRGLGHGGEGRRPGPDTKSSRARAGCALLPARPQRLPRRSALPRPRVLCCKRKMLLLDCNPEVRRGALPSCGLTFPGVCLLEQSTSEGDHCPLSAAESSLFRVDSLKHLLEAGASVNAPPDPCEQSPVHLAAGGGLACLLLWQLQTGADLNQQDVFGEAPLHKAAKVGSLECLSLLVARDARIDLCNKNGQTAEDLAWACGFLECARFLTTIKCMQTIKSSDQSDRDHCVPVLRQKRSFGSVENTTGKRKC